MSHPWFIITAVLVYRCTSVTVSCYDDSRLENEILGTTNFFNSRTPITNSQMKRQREECANRDVKRNKGNWSLGLLESIKNTNQIVKKVENIVVIKDKYPKAQLHYLVIPDEDIGSIFKLNKSHVGMIERFGEIYKELQQEHSNLNLRAGFHAVPHMHRLHMHVISQDMVSPCLKTKSHWNSFTTSFFIPHADLLKELRENGNIARLAEDKHKALLATPLKCNQCDFAPKNMPQLKDHLLTHL